MKTLILFLSCLFFLHTASQVTISADQLPAAGDVLTTRSALLSGSFDPDDTGPDHVWYFGFDVLSPLPVTDETVCLDVDESPLVYQFLFNNPFDPVHHSDFAYGVDQWSVSGITLEDAYFYFKKTNTQYTQTGAGVTINSIPVGSQGNPVDIVYHLPIQYGMEDEGDAAFLFQAPGLGAYRLTRHRHNRCTGYGTLHIWDQTFPVLLMKTTIEETDSLYLDFIGTGQTFHRPPVEEYKWLTPDLKVPVLQINTAGGMVTSVQTADIYTGIHTFTNAEPIKVFPNPTCDFLHISGISAGTSFFIFSMDGVLSSCGAMGRDALIPVSHLAMGKYILQLQSADRLVSRGVFVKE